MSSAPASSEARIDVDLICLRCGYNLRGLLPSGTCPECGTPADHTFKREYLAYANPHWVARIAFGFDYLAGALLIGVFVLVGLIMAWAWAVEKPDQRIDLVLLVGLPLACVPLVLSVVGCWRITMTEPFTPAEPWFSVRRLARAALVAACGLAGLLVLGVLGDVASGAFRPVVSDAIVLVWLAGLTAVVLPAVAMLAHAHTLARRLPDPGLATWTRLTIGGLLAGWALVLAMITAAVGVLLLLTCAVSILILLFRYQAAFEDLVHQARRARIGSEPAVPFKRHPQPPPLPLVAKPAKPMRDEPSPETVKLQDDLICGRCGYILRGLPSQARCPECGLPVAASSRQGRLHEADPEWLGTVKRGIQLMMAAMGLGLFLGCSGATVMLAVGPAAALRYFVALGPALAAALAIRRITTPEPAGEGETPVPQHAVAIARQGARLDIGLRGGGVILALIPIPGAQALLVGIGIIEVLVRMAVYVALARFGAYLAWRIGDCPLGREALIVGWAMAGLLSLITLLHSVALLKGGDVLAVPAMPVLLGVTLLAAVLIGLWLLRVLVSFQDVFKAATAPGHQTQARHSP